MSFLPQPPLVFAPRLNGLGRIKKLMLPNLFRAALVVCPHPAKNGIRPRTLQLGFAHAFGGRRAGGGPDFVEDEVDRTLPLPNLGLVRGQQGQLRDQLRLDARVCKETPVCPDPRVCPGQHVCPGVRVAEELNSAERTS